MKKKQLLATILAGTMVLSSLLTGCGSEAATEGEVKEQSTTVESTKVDTEPSTEEAVPEEPRPITIALQSHQQITDYEDNYFTNWLEEQLNIEIEFVMLPTDSTECGTKISLLLADGKNLPDMFITLGGLNNDSIALYGNDGYFLDISEYVTDSEVMPNVSTILEEYPDVAEAFYSSYKTTEGAIYGVGYTYKPQKSTYYVPFINQTWLDALDLEVPTTTDELKDVLIAFRDYDGNGNGINDEIPFYATINSGIGRYAVDAIINCFTYWEGNRGANNNLGVENGAVYAMFTTDEYREALKYLNELYEEKLIPDQIFTDTKDEYKAILKTEPTIVGFATSSHYVDLTEDMTWIPLLSGPEGISYTYNEPVGFSGGTAISADSENIDVCIELLDFFYSPEAYLAGILGEEGYGYTTDVDYMIELGIDEKYREKIEAETAFCGLRDLNGENHNQTWRGMQPYFKGWYDDSSTSTEVLSAGDETSNALSNAKLAGEVEYSYADWVKDNLTDRTPEETLPALKYTTAELEELAEITTAIDEHLWLTQTQFIKGDKDIEDDKVWETYLGEMESLGLSQMVAAAQIAYDRMK